MLDEEYVREERKLFGQVVCSFRYGREEDEVMGLNFQKELYLASEQVFPVSEKNEKPRSKMQERLLKKLGPNAYPFTFEIPPSAPASVTLQQSREETGAPCGVQYFVKVIEFSGTQRQNCGFIYAFIFHVRRYFLVNRKPIELIVVARLHWAFVRCNLLRPNMVHNRVRLFARTLC